MAYFRTPRAPAWFATYLALSVLAACKAPLVVDSDTYETTDLQASYRVVASNGVATATASFRAGPESTPIVQLIGGDLVMATQGAHQVVLKEQWTDAEWPQYSDDLPIDAAKFEFTLDLAGTHTAGSVVTVPPAFQVTSPLQSATIAAADGLKIAWLAEPLDDDDWWVSLSGDCIKDTSYIITPNPLATGPLTRDDDGSNTGCKVTVLVRRSLDGLTNPSFLPESQARGSREVILTVNVE